MPATARMAISCQPSLDSLAPTVTAIARRHPAAAPAARPPPPATSLPPTKRTRTPLHPLRPTRDSHDWRLRLRFPSLSTQETFDRSPHRARGIPDLRSGRLRRPRCRVSTQRHRRIANSAFRNFALSSETGVTTRRQADRQAPPHTARTPQPGTRPAPAVVRFLPAVSVNAR